MKTKPILFSTPMVQAILNGTKTQTRRIVKYRKKIQNPKVGFTSFTPDNCFSVRGTHKSGEYGESFFKTPIQEGDILWVRETYGISKDKYKRRNYKAGDKAGNVYPVEKWIPSIFMPKEACRLWLKVTDVSVERLQDISEDDAIAEGARGSIPIDKLCKHVDRCKNRYMHETLNNMSGHQLGFLDIWADINGLESWFANPWVWVYKFERCEIPKNFLS